MRQTHTGTGRIAWCSNVVFFSSSSFPLLYLFEFSMCLCQSGIIWWKRKLILPCSSLPTYTMPCAERLACEIHFLMTGMCTCVVRCVLLGMYSRLSAHGCCCCCYYCEGFFGIHLQQAHQSFSYFVRSFVLLLLFSFSFAHVSVCVLETLVLWQYWWKRAVVVAGRVLFWYFLFVIFTLFLAIFSRFLTPFLCLRVFFFHFISRMFVI